MTKQNILTVETYLRDHGPALSSEVSTFFQGRGLGAPTARKRLEHATGEPKRLYLLGRQHHQNFSFPKEQLSLPTAQAATAAAAQTLQLPATAPQLSHTGI